MHDPIWQRALLFANQRRPDLAIAELRRLLVEDPDHAPAHALLAQLLAGQRDFDGALAEARLAVAAAPDLPFAHHALGVVHFERDEYPEATAALERAIELDPEDADHHAMLAQVLIPQKRWSDALVAAEAALELDPQHTGALNLRSMALVRLGRKDEAADTLDASLAHDPDNPYTHQARGFALLHQGDARAALLHFQEALRRDPTLDGARAGLVEALKARNRVYRLLLGFLLWLERFPPGQQVRILFGAWLLVFLGGRVLDGAGFEDAAMVLGMVWLGIVLFIACTVPLFNLLMLLHPLGRHALERQQKNDALLLGSAMLVLCVALAVDLTTGAVWAEYSWPFALVFLLPVAGIGVFQGGWSRHVLQAFCAVTAVWFVVWVVQLQGLVASGWRGAAAAEPHTEQFRWFLRAAILSSWFVMLAPKGRPRRRRAD